LKISLTTSGVGHLCPRKFEGPKRRR